MGLYAWENAWDDTDATHLLHFAVRSSEAAPCPDMEGPGVGQVAMLW